MIALVPQLIGHTAFNYALKFVSAALVAVILLAEPIGDTLLAIPMLDEVPSPFRLIGGCLVLCGIVFVSKTRQSVRLRAAAEAEVTP